MLKEIIEEKLAVEQRLVDGNEEMLRLLSRLTPEDQKIYAPKVQAMIEQTNKTIKEVNSELYS